MRFTVKTRACLKCKISSRLAWGGGGGTYGEVIPYGRFSQNQNFYGALLRAIRARESSAIIINYYYYIYSQLLPINTVFLRSKPKFIYFSGNQQCVIFVIRIKNLIENCQ